MLGYILFSQFKSGLIIWKDFLLSFPNGKLPMMMYWPENIINQIKSPTLKQHIINTSGLYAKIYEEIIAKNQFIKTNPSTMDDFLWAMHIAGSRHIPFIDNLAEKPNFSMTISPIIDLLNHSDRPNAVIISEKDILENRFYYTVRSLRNISKGEQILVSYGEHSNLILAQRYGFVIENNPSSCIPVFFNGFDSVSSKYAEIMQDAQEEKIDLISQKIEKVPRKSIGGNIYRNRMEANLLSKLRIWMLSKKELENLDRTQDFKTKINSENEQNTVGCLKEILENKRAALPVKSEFLEMKNSKFDPYNSIENYILYNMKYLEHEETEILEKVLAFIKTKLAK